MKILYKFPSRSRKNKMFACIDNIIAMAKHDDYKIQLTLDYDDKEVIGNEVKERIDSYGDKVKAIYGCSETKIQAVNRDMEFSGEWDVVCLHSDDFWITKPGFDVSIVENMKHYFPDTDGVLHFPDQVQKQKLITYSIQGRKYFERFNYLFFGGYISVYADNEFTEVSKRLKRYVYIPEFYLEHRHKRFGFGPADALLKKTEDPMNYKTDGALFRERQKYNFYL
jgi:hypothetical protein